MYPINLRFLFWLLILLLAYLSPGGAAKRPKPRQPSAPPKTSNAYNGSDSKSAELFQGALSGLIEAGVMKIFTGEMHNLPNNNMYANTLLGALATDKPVRWFIESNYHKDEKSGKFIAADERREAMKMLEARFFVEPEVSEIFNVLMGLVRGSEPDHDEQPLPSIFPAFKQRITNAKIILDLLNFMDKDAKDLTRFINLTHLAIARVGIYHATHQVVRPNVFRPPWSPESTIEFDGFNSSRPTLSSQQEMVNGFSRAVKRGPAVLITTKKTLNTMLNINQTSEFENYYLSNGFSLLEVIFPSLNDSLHIISTCAVRPSITKVIAGSNDSHLFNFKHRCESSKTKEDL